MLPLVCSRPFRKTSEREKGPKVWYATWKTIKSEVTVIMHSHYLQPLFSCHTHQSTSTHSWHSWTSVYHPPQPLGVCAKMEEGLTMPCFWKSQWNRYKQNTQRTHTYVCIRMYNNATIIPIEVSLFLKNVRHFLAVDVKQAERKLGG